MLELQIESKRYKMLLEIMACYRKKENAISRDELARLLEVDDRSVRNLIKKARKRGIPILATSKSYGYFLDYTEEEISRFLNREILSRIKDLFETFHALAVHVKPVDPSQITIDEVLKYGK